MSGGVATLGSGSRTTSKPRAWLSNTRWPGKATRRLWASSRAKRTRSRSKLVACARRLISIRKRASRARSAAGQAGIRCESAGANAAGKGADDVAPPETNESLLDCAAGGGRPPGAEEENATEDTGKKSRWHHFLERTRNTWAVFVERRATLTGLPHGHPAGAASSQAPNSAARTPSADDPCCVGYTPMQHEDLCSLINGQLAPSLRSYAIGRHAAVESKWENALPDVHTQEDPLWEVLDRLKREYDAFFAPETLGDAKIRGALHLVLLLSESCESATSDILQAKIFHVVMGSAFRSHAGKLFRYFNGALTVQADSKLPKAEDVLFLEETMRFAQALLLGIWRVRTTCHSPLERNAADVAREAELLVQLLPLEYFHESLLAEFKVATTPSATWELCKYNSLKHACDAASRDIGNMVASYHRWCGSDINERRRHGVCFRDVFFAAPGERARKSISNECYLYVPLNFLPARSDADRDRLTRTICTTFAGSDGLQGLLHSVNLLLRGIRQPGVILMYVGPGQDGKTMWFVDMLQVVMGSGYFKASHTIWQVERELQQQGADFLHASLLVTDEADRAKGIQEASLKDLTGGGRVPFRKNHAPDTAYGDFSHTIVVWCLNADDLPEWRSATACSGTRRIWGSYLSGALVKSMDDPSVKAWVAGEAAAAIFWKHWILPFCEETTAADSLKSLKFKHGCPLAAQHTRFIARRMARVSTAPTPEEDAQNEDADDRPGDVLNDIADYFLQRGVIVLTKTLIDKCPKIDARKKSRCAALEELARVAPAFAKLAKDRCEITVPGLRPLPPPPLANGGTEVVYYERHTSADILNLAAKVAADEASSSAICNSTDRAATARAFVAAVAREDTPGADGAGARTLRVAYAYSLKVDGYRGGRRYAQGPSIQNLPRAYRAEVCRATKVDLDIEAAWPSILNGAVKEITTALPAKYAELKCLRHLGDFASSRKEIMAHIQGVYRTEDGGPCSADAAKELINSSLNGCAIVTWAKRNKLTKGATDLPKSVVALFKDFAVARALVTQTRPDLRQLMEGRPHADLSACSYALMELEDYALQQMEETARDMRISVAALCFDGIVLDMAARGVAAEEIGLYISEAERRIESALGFPLRIKHKPWPLSERADERAGPPPVKKLKTAPKRATEAPSCVSDLTRASPIGSGLLSGPCCLDAAVRAEPSYRACGKFESPLRFAGNCVPYALHFGVDAQIEERGPMTYRVATSRVNEKLRQQGAEPVALSVLRDLCPEADGVYIAHEPVTCRECDHDARPTVGHATGIRIVGDTAAILLSRGTIFDGSKATAIALLSTLRGCVLIRVQKSSDCGQAEPQDARSLDAEAGSADAAERVGCPAESCSCGAGLGRAPSVAAVVYGFEGSRRVFHEGKRRKARSCSKYYRHNFYWEGGRKYAYLTYAECKIVFVTNCTGFDKAFLEYNERLHFRGFLSGAAVNFGVAALGITTSTARWQMLYANARMLRIALLSFSDPSVAWGAIEIGREASPLNLELRRDLCHSTLFVPAAGALSVKELVGDGHEKVMIKCGKGEKPPARSGARRKSGVRKPYQNGWFMLLDPRSQRIVVAIPMKQPENGAIRAEALAIATVVYPAVDCFIYDSNCSAAKKLIPKFPQIKHFPIDLFHERGHVDTCKHAPRTNPVLRRRVRGINTQIAEQTFAWFRGYARSFNELRAARHRLLVLFYAQWHNSLVDEDGCVYLRKRAAPSAKRAARRYACGAARSRIAERKKSKKQKTTKSTRKKKTT